MTTVVPDALISGNEASLTALAPSPSASDLSGAVLPQTGGTVGTTGNEVAAPQTQGGGMDPTAERAIIGVGSVGE